MHWNVRISSFFLLLFLNDHWVCNANENETTNHHPEIHLNAVQAWSVKLGTELWHFGEFITRRKEVQECFKSAQVEPRDGKKILQSIVDDILSMMELKISAVRRIVENAENMALSKQWEPVPPDFRFYNSKYMKEPTYENTSLEYIQDGDNENVIPRPPTLDAHVEANAHFSGVPVNTSLSSVHLPGYVYAWAPEVIKGIYWSEGLKDIFKSNYEIDPTLSWQYFGSSTGFMRHYPAMRWDADPVDVYDCRTRAWYMEAAASPKDMVILVDRSGSMTGQRRDIAKHVVSNILDTLGTNDFVTVLIFSNTVEEVVPCFQDALVQATLANIREIKLGLDNYNTLEIANFTAALTHAFTILQDYRDLRGGANCNQAIMLVTDGVPYNYKEIFETWNWPNMPVRVFTYLIGREVKVAEVREVKWMACANRGFYVHLSTLAEVRERVLEHVSVMARPLVLQREEHPVIWTPVYANITDPRVADYLWEQRERKEQKERFIAHRRDKFHFNSEAEQEKRMLNTKRDQGLYSELGNKEYQLMTSISMPVYDRRVYENITENVLVNEALWVSVTKEVRIANLLGVAGTDVPLTELHALMSPYRIGANSYAFIVTNNGFILSHPDLRPMYQQILKPSYNSIDMTEIELIDDDSPPRNFSPEWLDLRQEIIDQETGSRIVKLKFHFDGMRRVRREKRQYHWRGIQGTPFTLVLSEPVGAASNRLVPPPTDDIHRAAVTHQQRNYLARHHLWTINPNWLYCRHYEKTFSSPEEQLLYFLDRMSKPGWRWPLKPRPPEHQHYNATMGKSETKSERDYYYCDHDLTQALVFDARATEWFNNNISISVKDDKGKEFIQRFGHVVAFLATQSGLTRWQTFPKPSEQDEERWEGTDWARAVESAWYSRVLRRTGYVFWTENGRVRGAVAAGAKSSAVVGYTVAERRLAALMMNVTATCNDNKTSCLSCQSSAIDCFLIDENGWIVAAKNEEHTEKFFGSVRNDIMTQFVEDGIFEDVSIVDYQAICFRVKRFASPANTIVKPLENLLGILSWSWATLIWIWTSINHNVAHAFTYSTDDVLYPSSESDLPIDNYDNSPPMRAKEREFDRMVLLNRTRPTPCDREMFLYELTNNNLAEKLNRNTEGCERPFVAQQVKHTNLLLVVVDATCQFEGYGEWGLEAAKEVIYSDESLPCYKHAHPLPRNRPKSCISNHANESTIDMCGGGLTVHSQKLTPIVDVLITLALFFLFR